MDDTNEYFSLPIVMRIRNTFSLFVMQFLAILEFSYNL